MVSDNQTMRRLIAENAESISGANNAGGSSFYRQADEHSGGFDLDEEELFSIEEAASALVYQDVAIRGPEWAKAAAEMKAAMAQRLPGTSEWNIGNGPGSLKNRSYAEREEEEEEKSAAFLELMGDSIEMEQELQSERQRREWATQTHSYAGIEMTGEEWGQFADALQGETPLRRWLVEEIMKKGKSQAEASKQADQIALLARMQSMPESDWTPEMRELDRELDQNPEKRRELDDYLNRGRDREAEIGRETARSAVNANQRASSDARADVLALDSGQAVNLNAPTSRGHADFPTAPNLTEEHGRAVAATEPLDALKPVQIASVPVQPSPVVSPGGGFDV